MIEVSPNPAASPPLWLGEGTQGRWKLGLPELSRGRMPKDGPPSAVSLFPVLGPGGVPRSFILLTLIRLLS